MKSNWNVNITQIYKLSQTVLNINRFLSLYHSLNLLTMVLQLSSQVMPKQTLGYHAYWGKDTVDTEQVNI